MKKNDISLQVELLFLEALYEQLDVGESLFNAIVIACSRVPQHGRLRKLGGEWRFRLIGSMLRESQKNGLSHQEVLDALKIHLDHTRLGELFDILSHQYHLGGDIQNNIQEVISYRIFEAYTDIEQKVEKAPIKLMLPLFACTFVGAWLFIGAALMAVMFR